MSFLRPADVGLRGVRTAHRPAGNGAETQVVSTAGVCPHEKAASGRAKDVAKPCGPGHEGRRLMVWVRISDDIDEHPKVASAGPLALAVQVAALAYCNRNLTDGFIPFAAAHSLLDWDIYGADGRRYTVGVTCGVTGDDVVTEWVIRECLLPPGIWDIDDQRRGYIIHDYADYQPSKEAVLKERESARERKAKSRAKSQRDAAVSHGHVTAHPVPVPVPVPVPKSSNGGTSTKTPVQDKPARVAYSVEFEAFWAAYPLKRGKDGAYRSWKKVRKRGIANDVLIEGARAYAADRNRDPEKTKFAQGWLSDGRWEDDYSVAPVAPALVRTTRDPEWAEKMLGEMDG
jgi:hypothetical protein